MGIVQSTYSERMDKARAGLLDGHDNNIQTGIVETAAGIGFGLAVCQGTADQGATLGGTLANFRGVSVRDVTLGAETDEYEQYKNIGILTRGRIWVTAGAAVSPGDPVHFDGTTGVFSNTGGQGPIKGARWVDTAAQNGLARVELSGYYQD